MKVIGMRLRDARLDAEMTQEEAAELMGLARTSIVNIEAGRQGITIERFLDFCHVYGASPARILGDVERMESLPARARKLYAEIITLKPAEIRMVCDYAAFLRQQRGAA